MKNGMILILILLIFRSLMASLLCSYISQLIRFARASSHVNDFNNHNKFLTAKLLQQGYRYHKLRKAFSKFYRMHQSVKNSCNKVFLIQNSMEIWYIDFNQRTNGPVNAHLISWSSKARNKQNLENIWQRNDLDLQFSHTFINSITNFRTLAAIVSGKSTVFTFPQRKN